MPIGGRGPIVRKNKLNGLLMSTAHTALKNEQLDLLPIERNRQLVVTSASGTEQPVRLGIAL